MLKEHDFWCASLLRTHTLLPDGGLMDGDRPLRSGLCLARRPPSRQGRARLSPLLLRGVYTVGRVPRAYAREPEWLAARGYLPGSSPPVRHLDQATRESPRAVPKLAAPVLSLSARRAR